MKRIVICCDGTWNTPDKEENGIPIATNVARLAQNVLPVARDGINQLLYYDVGIGTHGGWFERIFDGATGTGLSRNIINAYRFLIANYEKDDELFFFGFSRGAFTVRSLAGLIRNCGILRNNAIDQIDHGFDLYRSRSASTHPREREATLFRKTYSVAEKVIIKMIGVWDTVGALGNPLRFKAFADRRNQFHDTDLSSWVANAYQALAIDEKRSKFRATLWHQPDQSTSQVLEQVWFAGVHSNIGGGYPLTGLSDIALEWMIEKACGCNLGIGPISTQMEPFQETEESRTGFYKIIPPYYRPIAQTERYKGRTNECVHPAVIERYRQMSAYRPKNLVDYFTRNPDKLPDNF